MHWSRSSRRRRVWLPISCLLVVVALLLLTVQWWCRREAAPAHVPPTAEHVELPGASDGPVIAWVRGGKSTSHLLHVYEVLQSMGFTVANYTDEEGGMRPWHVLWSHGYPFKELRPIMMNLQPYQRVNHFPGSGFISNKVTLAESGLKSVPKAFRIPNDKQKLLEYGAAHPDKMFVLKSNGHRGIEVKPLSELDLTSEGSFVQEFVDRPLLVDGHKFDIGVYVVLMSVQPLRVYMYCGDVLLRFCPAKYEPFDSSVRDKYVVGDDYLPIWKVPSLVPYYTDQGFGMKESLDAWLRDNGKDPAALWRYVHAAIAEVFYNREESLIRAVSNYKSRRSFFEMMRFDLILDEDLRPYLMEANMSPNLSSAHFKQNILLYRQVVHSVLSVATPPLHEMMAMARGTKLGPIASAASSSIADDRQHMTAAVKDVAVFPEHCVHNCGGASDCDSVSCQLCNRCVSSELLRELLGAYAEHTRRGLCRRLVPPPITPPDAAHSPSNISDLNPDNVLITEWFRGKCILDVTFCT